MQLVERRVPITEKNLSKSRNGIYLLRDNFFKFWFKFVFENQEYIEQEKQEKLLDEKIIPELNTFAGRIFEEIAISEMIADKKYSNYLFGRWWDRTSEVDLVGIDKENKKVIIGEVKFKVLDKSEIKEIQKDLIEKAKKVNTFNFEHKLIIKIGRAHV